MIGKIEVVAWIFHLCLLSIGVFFFYAGAKRLLGFVPSLITVAGTGIAGGCFYSIVTDGSMYLIWFLTAILFWLGMEYITAFTHKQDYANTTRAMAFGIVFGILCYIDYIGFFLLLILFLLIIMVKERTKKERLQHISLMFGTVWFTILLLTAVLDMRLGEDFAWTLFRWFMMRIAMLYENQAVNQYGVIIIFLIYILLQSIWNKNRLKNVVDSQNEISMMQEMEEFDILEQELEITQTNQIENPLEVPKKEMDYGFEPPKELMHYDLNNYRLDDDYDLK